MLYLGPRQAPIAIAIVAGEAQAAHGHELLPRHLAIAVQIILRRPGGTPRSSGLVRRSGAALLTPGVSGAGRDDGEERNEGEQEKRPRVAHTESPPTE